LIVHGLVDRQALFHKIRSREKIALHRCKRGKVNQHFGPFPREPGSTHRQKGLQPGPAFRQMFPPFPEPKERDAKPETPFDTRTLNQPIESRAKVVMLDIAPRQPAGTLGFRKVWVSLLRQHKAISRVSAPRCRLL